MHPAPEPQGPRAAAPWDPTRPIRRRRLRSASRRARWDGQRRNNFRWAESHAPLGSARDLLRHRAHRPVRAVIPEAGRRARRQVDRRQAEAHTARLAKRVGRRTGWLAPHQRATGREEAAGARRAAGRRVRRPVEGRRLPLAALHGQRRALRRRRAEERAAHQAQAHPTRPQADRAAVLRALGWAADPRLLVPVEHQATDPRLRVPVAHQAAAHQAMKRPEAHQAALLQAVEPREARRTVQVQLHRERERRGRARGLLQAVPRSASKAGSHTHCRTCRSSEPGCCTGGTRS